MDNIALTSTPFKLFTEYNICKRDFNPSVPAPREHHLRKLIEKNSTKKGKEGNVYYVIPTEDFPFPSEFAQECGSSVTDVPSGAELTTLFRTYYEDVKSVQRVK
jgi:hypothetical protein